MSKYNEYAQILRVGESNRDASDKIRGFVYQDLIAIDLILSALDDDKVYVEWIEDIFIENPRELSICQVKHQPQSVVDFSKVYRDLFYQFLRVQLIDDKRVVKAFCSCHSPTVFNINKCRKDIKLKNENDIAKVNKDNILNKIPACKNIDERINLIFDGVANSNFLNNFNINIEKKDNINHTRELLKDRLHNSVKTNIEPAQMSENNVKDILLAVAIQFIQKSYYTKEENSKRRCMTKSSLLENLCEIFSINEAKGVERIKFIVLSYIDEIFSDIFSEIKDDSIAIKYSEIYKSTKNYFTDIMSTKEQRFKFLNTISSLKYDRLNSEIYKNKNVDEEKEIFLEHKEGIMTVIQTIWKVLHNIDCLDFAEYIFEKSDCFIFEFPNEKGNPVLIASSQNGRPKASATDILSRVKLMKNRPKKWYLRGYKAVCVYSYKVNYIDESISSKRFSVIHPQEDSFCIECMK